MKKVVSLAIALGLVAAAAPVFADGEAAGNGPTGQEQMKNVQTGARNIGAGWVEVLDSTHAEASKGKDPAEQITGVVAGGAIGVRRTIHRLGAGAIDLLTFWIPKKQPLINPEKARLE